MSYSRERFSALAIAVGLGVGRVLQASVSFQGLGLSSDGHPLLAEGVSGDGSVVVGRIFAATDVPIRWTRANGVERLDAAFGLGTTFVRSISADGTTVAVDGEGSASSPGHFAYAWSASGGRRTLQPAPGETAYAGALSEDGSVAIVNSYLSGRSYRAWIVDGSGGATPLGLSAGNSYQYAELYATAMTPNASVVVGYERGASDTHAVRWTASGGVLPLPGIEDAYGWTASAVDASGDLVVGTCYLPSGTRACRWVGMEVPELLPLAPGFTDSYAFSQSRDGSIVVGMGRNAAGMYSPWLWTQGRGSFDLAAVLELNGVDLSGWQLGSWATISADGVTIVGDGSHADSSGLRRPEGWVVTIPSPASAVAIGAFGMMHAGRRRKSGD